MSIVCVPVGENTSLSFYEERKDAAVERDLASLEALSPCFHVSFADQSTWARITGLALKVLLFPLSLLQAGLRKGAGIAVLHAMLLYSKGELVYERVRILSQSREVTEIQRKRILREKECLEREKALWLQQHSFSVGARGVHLLHAVGSGGKALFQRIFGQRTQQEESGEEGFVIENALKGYLASRTLPEIEQGLKGVEAALNVLDERERNPVRVRRFSVEVEGAVIDVCLRGRLSSLDRHRFMLAAMPNGACYEHLLSCDSVAVRLSEGLDATLVAFNYPQVGCSTGTAHAEGLAKAYKAVLAVLEKGCLAKEVIHYGFSMGGGVQALGMDGWVSESGVRHICVKDRTFDSLGHAAQEVVGSIVRLRGIRVVIGALARAILPIAGWGISTQACSQRLAFPEVILQAGSNAKTTRFNERGLATVVEMGSVEEIVHDGVIAPAASLGHAVGGSASCAGKKYCFVADVRHCDSALDINPLVQKVLELLHPASNP